MVTTKVKHSQILPLPRIFVYLPDFHKSGGPAHQLHSNLNQLVLILTLLREPALCDNI